MPFSDFETDTISIVKFDGQRFDGLKASVRTSRIDMAGKSPLIEAGDVVVCTRSNGAEDSYRVLDPGFHEGIPGIPTGYQMSVHKLDILSRPGKPGSTSSTFNGANSRVNVNSVDFAGTSSSLQAALQELAATIDKGGMTTEGRRDALEIVGAVKEQCESLNPSRTIVGALLRSLPAVREISEAGEAVLSLIDAVRS